jgi:hypothetical protein
VIDQLGHPQKNDKHDRSSQGPADHVAYGDVRRDSSGNDLRDEKRAEERDEREQEAPARPQPAFVIDE